MTPWWLGPVAPYDLETTGVNTREDRIVTGYVATILGRDRGRVVVPGTQVLINPGVPIPPEASRVHGVTDEIAQRKGCPPADGVYSLVKSLSNALKAGIPVAGFNVPFDFTLLYWECLRHGVPTVAEMMGYPPSAPVGPIVDAHVLDKQVDRYRPGSRKLDDSKGPGVASHYGVSLGERAHTADADAVAAALVAITIGERYANTLPGDLLSLHRAQKMWRAEQAAGLQKYLRTKGGKPEAYVDPCWPLCTDDTHPAG